jgi:diadenosine tetraphosphate (Ap4A) HIT family hydrolase
MECIICDRKLEKNILFENEQLIIMLAVEPSVNGHIQIFSREHYPILEMVPEETISKIISASNKVSMILFEALKVHGTNIIINNGVPSGQKIPHFSVDILPRRTDDNLKIDWTLKQAAPEALESTHRILEEGMNKPEEKLFGEKLPELNLDRKPEHKSDPKKSEEKTRDDKSGENSDENATNYYHQLFNRIP